MDECDRAVGEIEGDGGYILDIFFIVTFPLAVYRDGMFPQDVGDDGDVMRGEIPNHIDIRLEEPQIQPDA